MLVEITKKRVVLGLIAERSSAKRPTSYRALMRELLISADAACSHLVRLWRERLIASSELPATYLEAKKERRSIRELSFRVSRRGLERLARWVEHGEEEEW
jgi:hypothetical protein